MEQILKDDSLLLPHSSSQRMGECKKAPPPNVYCSLLCSSDTVVTRNNADSYMYILPTEAEHKLIAIERMNDKKMPDEWWHGLSWKTHLPNSQLISWPEQQHHISSSRTSLSQTPHVFILWDWKGGVCSQHAPQSASNATVLGIIQSATGCWLCLMLKLSIGDSKRPDGASIVLWLAPCLPLNWSGRERRAEKETEKCCFPFPLTGFWLCVVVFSVVWLNAEKSESGH